jgi:hypothetical protein
LGHDPSEYNFPDEMLRDLVPIYGDDLVRGLHKKLPRGLRNTIVGQVRHLTSEQEVQRAMVFESEKTLSPASTRQRLAQFFRMNNLRCVHCCAWRSDPGEFGIRDLREWAIRTRIEMDWVKANGEAVLRVLPSLEFEWPEDCALVRELLG